MRLRLGLSAVCFLCCWIVASSCDKVIVASNGEIEMTNTEAICSWMFKNNGISTRVKLTFTHLKNAKYSAEVWNFNAKGIKYYGEYNNELVSTSFVVPDSAFVVVVMDPKTDQHDVKFHHELTTQAADQIEEKISTYAQECTKSLKKTAGHIQNKEYPDAPPKDASCLWYSPVNSRENLKMSFTPTKKYDPYDEKMDLVFWQSNGTSLRKYTDLSKVDWPIKNPLLIYWHNRNGRIHSAIRLVYEYSNADAEDWHSKIPVCNQTIKSGSGFIASKNYPLQYDDNVDCIWRFQPPSNQAVYLEVIGMDIYNFDKFEDYLEFWIIDEDKIAFVGDHETLHKRKVIESTLPLVVKFSTNGQFKSSGFKISYRFNTVNASRAAEINKSVMGSGNKCHDIFRNERSMIKLRFREKMTKRREHLSCVWILKRNDDERTLINFPYAMPFLTSGSEFHLELWHNIENAPAYLGEAMNDKEIFATGTVMLHCVYFDARVAVSDIAMLVRPTDSSKCTRLFSRNSGSIRVRNGYLYEEERNCLWYFKPEENHKIRLVILDKNIDTNNGDFASIWSLSKGIVKLVANIESVQRLMTFESTGSIAVQFHSERTITDSQLRVQYSFETIDSTEAAEIENKLTGLVDSHDCRKYVSHREGKIDFNASNLEETVKCMWILLRNPNEITLLSGPSQPFMDFQYKFRIWDQLETRPTLHKIWHDPENRESSKLTGTIMIEMTPGYETDLPDFSVSFKSASPVVSEAKKPRTGRKRKSPRNKGSQDVPITGKSRTGGKKNTEKASGYSDVATIKGSRANRKEKSQKNKKSLASNHLDTRSDMEN